MRFPVLLCGVFALCAVAAPVHYHSSAGKAGKDMVVPYYPAANFLPWMQVTPGSAYVNTANAVANMMLASISTGNFGAVSAGTPYRSTVAGLTTGTSNGNGVSGNIVNLGTGFADYIPMDTIVFDTAVPNTGLTIDNTGTPVNSNGANSVNANTNQHLPSVNMNTFMIGSSKGGNVNSNTNKNVNSGFGISNLENANRNNNNNRNLNLNTNNNGFNFKNKNNNNNDFSFNRNNNGFNLNNNGLNFNSNRFNVNNNGINTNGLILNNIGSANSNRNTNGNGANSIINAVGTVGDMNGAASGAYNVANVMVMSDRSGNVQNGNQLMTGNGQTGNVVTGTVPANGPMSGMEMLEHGPPIVIFQVNSETEMPEVTETLAREMETIWSRFLLPETHTQEPPETGKPGSIKQTDTPISKTNVPEL